MLRSKKRGSGGGTTLISADTTINGDVRFSGSLDVEGVINGNVIAEQGNDSRVRVLGKGKVAGEIRAPYVLINGSVEGDVYATKELELAIRGRVKGNVFYALLEMAAGSEVNGGLAHLAEPEEPVGR